MSIVLSNRQGLTIKQIQHIIVVQVEMSKQGVTGKPKQWKFTQNASKSSFKNLLLRTRTSMAFTRYLNRGQ